MNINNETIERLAHLARLEFTEDEKEHVKNDLQKMVDFCEKLNEVDTTGVEPLIFMTNEENMLREDIVTSYTSKKDALKNAPDKDSDYFRVPKVIDR